MTGRAKAAEFYSESDRVATLTNQTFDERAHNQTHATALPNAQKEL